MRLTSLAKTISAPLRFLLLQFPICYNKMLVHVHRARSLYYLVIVDQQPMGNFDISLGLETSSTISIRISAQMVTMTMPKCAFVFSIFCNLNFLVHCHSETMAWLCACSVLAVNWPN